MVILSFFAQEIEVACEAYFDQQSSKCVTSDRTLTSQNIPRMDQQVPNWNFTLRLFWHLTISLILLAIKKLIVFYWYYSLVARNILSLSTVLA